MSELSCSRSSRPGLIGWSSPSVRNAAALGSGLFRWLASVGAAGGARREHEPIDSCIVASCAARRQVRQLSPTTVIHLQCASAAAARRPRSARLSFRGAEVPRDGVGHGGVQPAVVRPRGRSRGRTRPRGQAPRTTFRRRVVLVGERTHAG